MKIPADRRTGSDGKSGHYFTDRFMSRLMRLTPQLQRPLGHPIHVFICLGRCAGGRTLHLHGKIFGDPAKYHPETLRAVETVFFWRMKSEVQT